MTAQAGAVGEVIRNAAGQVYIHWRDGKNIGDFIGATFYTTPPAAVPVEALKGLMAGLEDSIAHNDESEDWLRGAKTAAQFIRDELTQLIKERSNGR